MLRRRLRSLAEAVSRPTGRASSLMVIPNTPLLQQVLDEYGLKHTIDQDGDLQVPWEKCQLYFFQYGEQNEVLQLRLYLTRRFPVETRPAIALALDDWNRTKLFPKAYTVLPDDGMVGICAEQVHDFHVGATRDQIHHTVGAWIETLLRFANWVDEQFEQD
ncbi:MAG TPA: YbjN domain-containing protein [Jatrophihabitantaceae bacterium]|nr:YbjN domain-containing protein [Jatrophihabitantaceae bacterium]